MRKKLLILSLCLLISSLFAEILFYDNFNRADGDVGNDWQYNTPENLTNSSIIDSV